MKHLMYAAALALATSCSAAYAETCYFKEEYKVCDREPGEVTFETQTQFIMFAQKHNLVFLQTVITTISPNALGLDIGTRIALWANPAEGVIYGFARRTPDGPLELLSTAVKADSA